MKKHLRSIWDHIWFFQIQLSSHPRLLIGAWVLIPLISLVLSLSRGPSALGLLLALLLGSIILPLLQAVTNLLRAGTSGRVKFKTPEGLLDTIETAQHLPSDTPKGLAMVPRGTNVAPIMHSPEFDLALRAEHRDWQLTLTTQSATYARVIETLRLKAPQWRSYGQRLFLQEFISPQPLTNETKILFDSALSLDTETVTLGKTDYLAGVCTADLSLKSGMSTATRHQVILPARDRWGYVEANGTLYAPALTNSAQNPMSLHLGADVVIVTKDDRMPLAVQNIHNLQHPETVVPFASGSMDWEDIGDAKSLKQVVLTAARRELQEEWGGPDKNAAAAKACEAADLKILGFYREMNRGGKPQFVVGGRINLDYALLVPEKAEVVRTEHEEAVPLVYTVQDMDQFAKKVITTGLENLPRRSQAIFGAFWCLRSAIANDPAFVADLFGIK